MNWVRKAGKVGAYSLRKAGKVGAYGVSGFSAVYCFGNYVGSMGVCEDTSMEPTIQHGDKVIISPISIASKTLQKGDVVFCRHPRNPGSIICKRVIAMEYEYVYNSDKGYEEFVRRGHVWLEGDNKENSIDSRKYGDIPYGLIAHKVMCRIWPYDRIGWVDMPEMSNKVKLKTFKKSEKESDLPMLLISNEFETSAEPKTNKEGTSDEEAQLIKMSLEQKSVQKESLDMQLQPKTVKLDEQTFGTHKRPSTPNSLKNEKTSLEMGDNNLVEEKEEKSSNDFSQDKNQSQIEKAERNSLKENLSIIETLNQGSPKNVNAQSLVENLRKEIENKSFSEIALEVKPCDVILDEKSCETLNQSSLKNIKEKSLVENLKEEKSLENKSFSEITLEVKPCEVTLDEKSCETLNQGSPKNVIVQSSKEKSLDVKSLSEIASEFKPCEVTSNEKSDDKVSS